MVSCAWLTMGSDARVVLGYRSGDDISESDAVAMQRGTIIWLGCNTQYSAPLLPCAQKLLLALALWHRLPRPNQIPQVTAPIASCDLHRAVMVSCTGKCAFTLL